MSSSTVYKVYKNKYSQENYNLYEDYNNLEKALKLDQDIIADENQDLINSFRSFFYYSGISNAQLNIVSKDNLSFLIGLKVDKKQNIASIKFHTSLQEIKRLKDSNNYEESTIELLHRTKFCMPKIERYRDLSEYGNLYINCIIKFVLDVIKENEKIIVYAHCAGTHPLYLLIKDLMINHKEEILNKRLIFCCTASHSSKSVSDFFLHEANEIIKKHKFNMSCLILSVPFDIILTRGEFPIFSENSYLRSISRFSSSVPFYLKDSLNSKEKLDMKFVYEKLLKRPANSIEKITKIPTMVGMNAINNEHSSRIFENSRSVVIYGSSIPCIVEQDLSSNREDYISRFHPLENLFPKISCLITNAIYRFFN